MSSRRVTNDRQQLGRELQQEILPGTEIMADVGAHRFVKSGDSQRVLVPQPSNDPHDPLNWSTTWKLAVITASTWVTFTQGFGPLAIAPQFPYYIEEFRCTLADVVQFTGVCILVLGFSNFLWVPISSSFGRRPVYIASQAICLGAVIWRARATSYNSFMGACILNGIGAGPAETIQPTVITDIFFLHTRGRWNTLYWVAYMGSLMVGPIIAGPMGQILGWRSFWWLNVVMIGSSLLMVIFMFPETKYERNIRPNTKESSTSSLELEDKVEFYREANFSLHASKITSYSEPGLGFGRGGQGAHVGKGGPSKGQWALFQANRNPFRRIFLDLWIPWKLFAFPIVEFASFVVSWSCSSFLTINLIQSQALAAPPYNLNSQQVGFTNFAILVGAIVGLATAGPLSDYISDRATRRNGGIREPEMRLPAMIPYVIIMFIGNVVVAFGFQYQWPWQIIVVIGFGFAGLQVAALPSIVSTYAVDSYKPVAGSLFVSITVNKNVWGYGFSKFITPWSMADGFVPPVMTNACLILLWCLFGILFYYKGKTFRRWSKNSNVHQM